MSSPHFQRAQLLISQNRHDMAEQELRLALVDDPNSPFAHGLLCVCLLHRKAYAEATSEAEQAIHLAPDLGYGHYVLALVMLERNRFSEAETAIREAITLDPQDEDFFALQAAILLQQKKWQAALEAADQGLAIDPEHVRCANLRAIALTKTGRRQSAADMIETALERDPENADTHANLGWVKLEQRRHKEALEHFREALRLDPASDWARAGVVEALKARNVIYRIMLAYFFWMAKLSEKGQWLVIIVAYVGYRFLLGIKDNQPELGVWIKPVLWLYIAFVVLTWIAQPLFNLLLRLNRYGRLALSRRQIVASNWVGLCMLGALILLGLGLALGNESVLLSALMCGLLVMPIAVIFNLEEGWPRQVMTAYTLGLLACAAISSAGLLSAPIAGEAAEAIGTLAMLAFFVGVFVSQFLANWLAGRTPRH